MISRLVQVRDSWITNINVENTTEMRLGDRPTNREEIYINHKKIEQVENFVTSEQTKK